MEVLALLFTLALFAVLVGILLLAVGAGLAVVWAWWPTIAGVVVGVWLWRIGHDNWAVILGILALLSQVRWSAYLDSGTSYHNPMQSKKAIYNENGEVVGYVDH